MTSPEIADPFLLKSADQSPVLVVPLGADCLLDGDRADRWFEQSKEAVTETQATCVVLDCEQVAVVCGSGLGKILRLYKELHVNQGRLALCNLSRPLAEIIQITRIDKVLTIEKDLEAAYMKLASVPGR